jgi:hypothetical protein
MENKTRRSFKYAIGEIMLVVIRMGIALHINNGSKQRKEKIKAQTIRRALKEDY